MFKNYCVDTKKFVFTHITVKHVLNATSIKQKPVLRGLNIVSQIIILGINLPVLTKHLP